MKKVLLIILLILMVGCNNTENESIDILKDIDKKISTSTKELSDTLEEVKNRYYDTNPIKVGLYDNGQLIHEVNAKFQNNKDIAVFDILFTNQEKLDSNNIKTNWYKYYNQYKEDISEYKIGFYIELEANNEKKTNLFLDPSSQYKLAPYLYPFVYDSVHATGWHTHITMDTLKKDSIYSTIKLYLYNNVHEITSPIYLTVFTYKDDNDFLDGVYRGNSKHTVVIYNK